MFNMDIIIPTTTNFRKFQNYSLPTYRWNRYWFPVWYYQKDLKKMGVKIRFLHNFNMLSKKKENFQK